MKQYTVYFTEPVSHTFVGMRYNYANRTRKPAPSGVG